jgi:hypothetical protein
MDGLGGLGMLLVLIGGGAMLWLRGREQRRRIARQRRRIVELERQNARLQRALEAQGAAAGGGAAQALPRPALPPARPVPMPSPPPGVLATVRAMEAQGAGAARDPYLFPVGWELARGRPGVVSLSLTSGSPYRSGNIAVTGESQYGKGTLVFLVLAALCLRATPAQLQLLAIDPKRDFGLWRGKAHNWREPVLGRDAALTRAAMAAVTAERERRARLREQHGVVQHEDLPDAVRPPVLVVYVGELNTLRLDVPEVEKWLTSEMSTVLADGIRFLIDDQNTSGKVTDWRTHIGTYIAGFQASQDWVRPNIGMGVDELRELGGVPMNKFAGPGYFTVRSGVDVATVRAPWVDIAARQAALALLPDASQPLSIDAGPDEAGKKRPEVIVTPEEEARILAAAALHTKRTEVCAAAFGGATTGEEYTKTKAVLDRHRLLVPGVALRE